MKNLKENEMMMVRKVAEYLQMDEHTIYKLSRCGKIPSIKINGQWRFKKEVVEKWISEESLEITRENRPINKKVKSNDK